MSALKAVALIIGISLVYYGLADVAGSFTGAGHGSYFFLAAIQAPFSASEFLAPAAIIFWPVISVLLALRRFFACRIAVSIALVLHYLGIVVVSCQTEWYYIGKVCHSLPVEVAVFSVVYFGSQFFMWFLITRRHRPA